LALAAAEVILRLGWEKPQHHTIRFKYWTCLQPDDELGWIPRPNAVAEYPMFHAAFGVNSRGLRGPETPVSRQPGRHRVVVLGDSFAWGHGVGPGDAFPEMLAEMIPHLEVVNLGVPGFDLDTERRFFERVGAQYAPDVVLVALCQNDIIDKNPNECPARKPPGPSAEARTSTNSEPGATNRQPASNHDAPLNAKLDHPQPGSPQGGEDGAPLRSFKVFLRERLYLYAFCQEAVNANKSIARAAVRLGLKEELAGYEMLDDNLRPALLNPPLTMQRAFSRLDGDLVRLEEAVRSNGALLVVAVIPAIQAVDRRQLLRSIAHTKFEAADFDLDRPGRLVKKIAAEHGIAVVDPLPRFREAQSHGLTLYLPGDLHFNVEGHRLFAETLCPALRNAWLAHDSSRNGSPSAGESPDDPTHTPASRPTEPRERPAASS